MTFSKIFFFVLITLFNQKTFAEMITATDQDVLATLAHKLENIDQYVKDQRVFVTSAVLNWPEVDDFRFELMFTVAHDPQGPILKDVPSHLSPSYLTERLKQYWLKLELSVLEMGNLAKDPDWIILAEEMDRFFKLREKYLYQAARNVFKTTDFNQRIYQIKQKAKSILSTSSENNHLSVRVMDPYFEKLASELAVLNRSVRELKEFKKPVKVEERGIFQSRHYTELIVLAVGSLVTGILIAFSLIWAIKKIRKGPRKTQQKLEQEKFNYNEWLNHFEKSIQATKINEEKTKEGLTQLKNLVKELGEVSEKFNSISCNEDFENSLEQLNNITRKIEGHFERVTTMRSSESSKKIFGQVFHLCEAIENKKTMSYGDEKPKSKYIKINQETYLKAI